MKLTALDIDISNATGALVNISGSSDLTLHAEKIVQVVADKLILKQILGVLELMSQMLQTTVVVSGIKSDSSSSDSPGY